MILGMTLFTFVHVLISLVAIVTGFVVLAGLWSARRLPGWTAIFLLFSILTDVTGYMFVRPHILPSHIVGAISLVLLAIACFALYGRHLAAGWRGAYAVTAVIALYLNVFVLVVQAFLKVPALHALAPAGSETPFKLAQGVVLLFFIFAGWRAARKFRPVL